MGLLQIRIRTLLIAVALAGFLLGLTVSILRYLFYSDLHLHDFYLSFG